MPRRNDRERRLDPRELEFWRNLNCTEEDPCSNPHPKNTKKNKRRRNRAKRKGTKDE